MCSLILGRSLGSGCVIEGCRGLFRGICHAAAVLVGLLRRCRVGERALTVVWFQWRRRRRSSSVAVLEVWPFGTEHVWAWIIDWPHFGLYQLWVCSRPGAFWAWGLSLELEGLGPGLSTSCVLAVLDQASSGKKHFVLVHGAVHSAWCLYEMASLLNSIGHHDITTLDLAKLQHPGPT
ncbi:hypothetical protein ACLB2K_045300 [Fragaria x ananassa]